MTGGHTSIAFNVGEDDYETFIKSPRSILSHSRSHDIGVLMPQTELPSWLDIHLRSGDFTIILRIDKRNLYVRGYSRDNGTTFWEFSDSSLISGSTPLAYIGSYVDGCTLINVVGVTHETVQLGWPNLRNAIATLATTENPNSPQNNALQNGSRAMLLLTQMFAKSCRFQLIIDQIVTNWYDSAPLPGQLVELQQGFESLSSAVQRADLPHWTNNTPLPNMPNPNRANIWTVGQAIATLGILLYVSRTSSREKRQAVIVDANTNVSYVRTLVSIEYIRVNNIDDEDPGDLYGTVTVQDFNDHY